MLKSKLADDLSLFTAIAIGVDCGLSLKDKTSDTAVELSLIHISEPTRPY